MDLTPDSTVRDRRRRWKTFTHRQPLLFLLVGAALGIAIDAMGMPSESWVYVGGILSLVAGTSLFARRPESCLGWLPMSLLALVLAGSWHAMRGDWFDRASVVAILSDDPQAAVMEGTVVRPATLRRNPLAKFRRDAAPFDTRITLRLQRLRIGRDFQDCSGTLMLDVRGRAEGILPGDDIRVFGQLRRFASPTNPGESDLRKIYQRQGFHGRVNVESAKQIERLKSQNWNPYRMIALIANRSRELLFAATGESQRPLAVALVIGQRDFVSDEMRDQLLATGTAHLLSVSGLHLAIIVVIARFFAMILPFPPLVRIALIVLVCAFYTAITGGRPPVMRAAILVAVFMIAIWMRQPAQPLNTLAFAGLVLLVANPQNLFNVGVHLSFLAVTTLVLCGRRSKGDNPTIDQTVERDERLKELEFSSRGHAAQYAQRSAEWLGNAIWFSACVTAISMPLVWQQFHIVSWISVLTNVLVGLLLFVALAAGVFTVALGMIAEPLMYVPGAICDWTLAAMYRLIQMAASVPGGHFWLPSPPAWMVAAFYEVIVCTLFLSPGRRATFSRMVWIVVWTVAAWWMATTPARLAPQSVEATFVDVGHGTSVILRFGEDDVWMYDCGRLGNDSGSSRDIDATLWSLGATRIRGLILSHADSDHYNAVPGVLRRFSVAKIYTPPGMLDESEPGLVPTRRAIEKHRIPIVELARGDRIAGDSRVIDVVHPPRSGVGGNDNANSLVLVIHHAGRAIILPGDLEPPGTGELISQPRPSPGGVLMAPHHGSLRMNAEAVLQWSRPVETIVSGGRRAKRPEVRDMLAITGSGVHVTSEVGAIRVRLDRDSKIEVRRWGDSPW